MNDYTIKNAVIKSVKFDTERGLSAWLMLDYGDSGQGFGGYLLYAPKGWEAHGNGMNYAGHFIWRCMEIAGVDDWAKLAGKNIRVKADHNGVKAIGHIIEDKWFEPAVEFTAMGEADAERRKAVKDVDELKAALKSVSEECLSAKAERDALQSKLNSLSTYSGLVNELAEKLAGDGPENFIERTANHPSFGQFTMTLQKTEGITPAGLLAMANLDLAKARALLYEIDGHSGVIISGLASDLLKRIHAFLNGSDHEPIPQVSQQDDDCLRFKRERDMLLDALWQLANNAAFNEVEVLRSADKDKADILRKRIARAMAVIKVVMGEHWLYPSQRAIIAELRKDGLFVRETVEVTEGNYVTFLKADNCAFELKVKKARAA